MSVLIIIILIVLLIVEHNKVRKLQETKQHIKKFCPNCGQNLMSDVSTTNTNIPVRQNDFDSSIKTIKEVKVKDPVEIKNKYILITGAILVLLSAVILLTTTWDTSNNYFKSLILLFMFCIFSFSSYIAKNKLKLNDTALTFRFIALGYLPILFYSFGLFELFGNFFSINGEGKYIYLSICSLIITYIYYKDSKLLNNKVLMCIEYGFHITSLYFLVSIFTDSINVFITALLVYLIITALYAIQKKYLYNKNTTNNTLQIIFYSCTAIFIFNLIDQATFSTIIESIVLFITAKIIFNIYLKDKNYNYFWPLLANGIAYSFIMLITKDTTVFITFMSLVNLLLIGFELGKRSVINNGLYYEAGTILVLLYINGLFNNINLYFIPLIIFFISSLITFFYNEELKKIIIYLLPTSLFILCYNVLIYYNIELSYLTIFTFITMMISLLSKDKTCKRPFYIIGSISGIISLLIIFGKTDIESLIYAFILIISFLFPGIRNKKRLILWESFIYLNFFMFDLFTLLNLNYLVFPALAASLIIYITCNYMLKDFDNVPYEIIQYSFLLLMCNLAVNYFELSIIIPTFYVLYKIKYKYEKMRILPFILIIPLLFNTNFVLFKLNIFIPITLLIMLLICYLISEDKKRDYNIFLLLGYYVIFLTFGINKYFNLLILWAILYLLYYKRKNKIYLAGSYIVPTVILNNIIYDLSIDDITVLNIGIYFIPAILITNLVSNIDNKKLFKYICYSIVNIIAMMYLVDGLDRFLFIVLLLLLVIYGYLKKDGPLFIISLFSIIINAFIFTKIIWINIPWWIYILAIGCLLIFFAVNNEIKNKTLNKEKFHRIKEKLDL